MVPIPNFVLALELAKRGADKSGCDGWRAQEMCRQIVVALGGSGSLSPNAEGISGTEMDHNPSPDTAGEP